MPLENSTTDAEPSALPALPLKRLDLEGRVSQLLDAQRPAVLMTILSTQGHVARKAGTRALFTENGLEGTLGGGLFEVRALEEANRCLAAHESCLFTYTGLDDAGRGERTVLCEYLTPSQSVLFASAQEAISQGIRGGWMLDMHRPSQPKRSLLLESDTCLAGFDSPTAVHGIRSDLRLLARLLPRNGGKPYLTQEGGSELYFEPLIIPPVLLLCGAGHVACACASLAQQCGFTVDVVDDREGFASYERFPLARACLTLPDFDDLIERLHVAQQHFVVIMTHSHALDLKVLSQILASSACYIGLLGSSTKRRELYAKLRANGVPSTELAAVHCPVGLQIGAETPEQIAVSIVAELLAARTGTLKQLRSSV